MTIGKNKINNEKSNHDIQYDLVLNNGNIISFDPDTVLKNCSVGVSEGIIKEISDTPLNGKTVVDVTGKYVAPGFIDFHSHVSGKKFSAECVIRQGATTTISGERNFDRQVIKDISQNGFLINHGFHISHSFTLRRAVGHRDIYTAATTDEINDMKTLLEEFLKSGAFAVHFGLEYVPGTSFDEILALSEIAKKYDRPLLMHTRGDGINALDHFQEIEKVMKQTGVSVHLVHLVYMTGYQGYMEKSLELIKNWRSLGYDVTVDTGLYPAYPSCFGSSLLHGDWTKRYGGRISEKDVLISSGIYTGEFCTKERFNVLRERFPYTMATVFVGEDPAIDKAIVEPFVMISSNSADGPHYEDVGHPESAGTFPKLLGYYVRTRKLLELIPAVSKITREPALRFGVPNKGFVKEGYDADIVVFDFDKIMDCAKYACDGDPNEPPEGIDLVYVNGKQVCSYNVINREKNYGKTVKHKSYV